MNTALIEYCSNINAVSAALQRCSVTFQLLNVKYQEDLVFKNILLPGVSSFDSSIERLNFGGLSNKIKQNAIEKRSNIIGICAGAQILFDSSEEGDEKGLGLLQGRVKRININSGIKVPHLGWNNIILNKGHPMAYLFDGIDIENKKFYFSHSYCFPDSGDALAYVDYGERFPVVVAKNNIIAIQFHPEKSYNQGLKLLSNICKL